MPIPQYPQTLLRKKLVVAGIPESEHSMESLAARMPADFSAQSFQDMSADMIAELLLYLIAKGNALAAVKPGLERYMAKGQMQIRHYTEFYTNPNGTVKPADTLRDQFAEMGSTARDKGFRGLRASGSVSWINNEESMSRFMDYETKVHCAIQGSRMMAVCTYPARAAAFNRSRELIHNHGKIYVKRGESVHDNSRDAEKIEAVFASLRFVGRPGSSVRD